MKEKSKILIIDDEEVVLDSCTRMKKHYRHKLLKPKRG